MYQLIAQTIIAPPDLNRVALFMYYGQFHLPEGILPAGFRLWEVGYCDDESFVCLITSDSCAGLLRVNRRGEVLGGRSDLFKPMTDGDTILRSDSTMVIVLHGYEYHIYCWSEAIARPHALSTVHCGVPNPPSGQAYFKSLERVGPVLCEGGGLMHIYSIRRDKRCYGFFSCNRGQVVYQCCHDNEAGLDLYSLPFPYEPVNEMRWFARLPEVAHGSRVIVTGSYFSPNHIVVVTQAFGLEPNFQVYHYRRRWAPSIHHLFTKQQREVVKALYLLQRQGALDLARDLLPQVAQLTVS